MGESAGALSIAYLLASPRARGLFGRAIVQSANMRAVPALREVAYGLPPAEATGTVLADSVGAADIAALRRIDANALSSEEHTSELPSLMRISHAVFCLKTKTTPI